MGGGGFGQVKLGLMHEILGACIYAPSIFGNNAPDSGNAELIAVGGTDEQKRAWMQPLLDGRAALVLLDDRAGRRSRSHAADDAGRARDGDEWVINGHKWFSSNAIDLGLPHRDVHDEPRRRARTGQRTR